MSNGNIFERVFKLWASISKMMIDGTRDPHKIAGILQKILDEGKVFLRHVRVDETIAVPAVDGNKVFEQDPNFSVRRTHSQYKASNKRTDAITVSIYKIVRQGNLEDFFGSLGPNRLCWQTEDQIMAFCKEHYDKVVSCHGPSALFQLEGGWVVHVRGDRLPLVVSTYSIFSDLHDWNGEEDIHLVLPLPA